MYIMPLVATLLMGCGPGGSSFSIEGKFSDMAGGELYMYNLYNKDSRFDTITVNSGKFSYEGECNEATPYMLVFPNAMEQVIFVAPGKEITYEVSSTDLKNYVVKGTDENETMNKFRQSISADPTQSQKIVRQYIEENSSSVVAIYLFDRYYVQNSKASEKDIRIILGILKKAQPKNDYLLNIEGGLNERNKNRTGKVVPDVTIRNAAGDKCKLWDKKKEGNTIVFFWASWANGYYDFIWKVREYVREHRDDTIKGRYVGISLDVDLNRFISDARTDEAIGIEQYCDGLGLESDAFKKLGVPDVPYYVIVDNKHKILTTGDDPDKLKKDLKKYFGN